MVKTQGSLWQLVEKVYCPSKGRSNPCLGGGLPWPREDLSLTCCNAKSCPRPDVSSSASGSMPRASVVTRPEPGRAGTVLAETPWAPDKGNVGLNRECKKKPGKWGGWERRKLLKTFHRPPSPLPAAPLFPIQPVHNGSNRCVMP